MKRIYCLLLVVSLLCLNGLAQESKKSAGTKATTKKTSVTKTPDKPEAGDKVISGRKGPEGQAVYEGVKGGIYYINKNGNKTYLKEDDKLVANKKGPNGEKVYTGPKGGEYYINKNGNKIYLKTAGK